MSIVEADKLVVLISDLSDMLSSWDVSASDACQHTKKVSAEDVEISNLAEKDKSRALETENTDRQAIEKSKKESLELYEKSSELHKLAEPLPKQAQNRLLQAQNFLKQSQQNNQKSNEWHHLSERELQRAQKEYEEALEEYNRQVDIRNDALRRFQNTPETYTVRRTDNNGNSYTETRHNPEWDRAKAAFEREEAELKRRKQILDKAKKMLELAQEQFQLSTQAMQLSRQMLNNSQHLLERTKDLKEWSDNAYKSSAYAVSAAKSALNLDEEAEKQNSFQKEYNEDTVRVYERIKTSVEEVVNAVQKIVEITDSCNAMNVDYRTRLDGKKTLLQKFAKIVPDDIQPLSLS